MTNLQAMASVCDKKRPLGRWHTHLVAEERGRASGVSPDPSVVRVESGSRRILISLSNVQARISLYAHVPLCLPFARDCICVCGMGCVPPITMGVMNVSVQVKLSQSQRRLRGQ